MKCIEALLGQNDNQVLLWLDLHCVVFSLCLIVCCEGFPYRSVELGSRSPKIRSKDDTSTFTVSGTIRNSGSVRTGVIEVIAHECMAYAGFRKGLGKVLYQDLVFIWRYLRRCCGLVCVGLSLFVLNRA
jgi:hypothetical protein